MGTGGTPEVTQIKMLNKKIAFLEKLFDENKFWDPAPQREATPAGFRKHKIFHENIFPKSKFVHFIFEKVKIVVWILQVFEILKIHFKTK